MSTAQYQYEAIDITSDTIRLIEILAGTGPTVECKLHTTSLNKASKYVTLSYVWGPPSPAAEVYIDGNQVLTRRNLYNALVRIRKHIVEAALEAPPTFMEQDMHRGGRLVKGPDQWRYFWIDAISIDQRNPHERSHQVGLMGEIYEQSDLTLVWLGLGDSDTDYAIDYLNQLEIPTVSSQTRAEVISQTKDENAVIVFPEQGKFKNY